MSRLSRTLPTAGWIALSLILCLLGGGGVADAQSPTLALAAVPVYPGQSGVPVELTLSHINSVEGIEIGLQTSSALLEIDDVILVGGVLEGLPLELSLVEIAPGGQSATIRWILDSTVPFDLFLPPGQNQLLGTVLCSVDDDLLPGQSLTLDFVDGLGSPPLDNTVYASSIPRDPVTVSGVLSHFSEHQLAFDTAPTFPGAVDHLVDVILNNEVNIQGFSLAITYDPAVMTCTYLGIVDTITELSNAEFVEEIIDVVPGEAILGVLLDVLPPYGQQMIPASGVPLPIAKMHFSIDNSVTGSVFSPIRFTDGIGTPGIENLLVIGGASIFPETVDTFLEITGSASFLRADADRNRRLDLADVVLTLFYVMGICDGCPPITCMAALDANDDGRVDMADGVWTGNYLFSGGPPPPPPFPNFGPDPTPDNLTCDEY